MESRRRSPTTRACETLSSRSARCARCCRQTVRAEPASAALVHERCSGSPGFAPARPPTRQHPGVGIPVRASTSAQESGKIQELRGAIGIGCTPGERCQKIVVVGVQALPPALLFGSRRTARRLSRHAMALAAPRRTQRPLAWQGHALSHQLPGRALEITRLRARLARTTYQAFEETGTMSGLVTSRLRPRSSVASCITAWSSCSSAIHTAARQRAVSSVGRRDHLMHDGVPPSKRFRPWKAESRQIVMALACGCL
jgi:hypothetical protein